MLCQSSCTLFCLWYNKPSRNHVIGLCYRSLCTQLQTFQSLLFPDSLGNYAGTSVQYSAWLASPLGDHHSCWKEQTNLFVLPIYNTTVVLHLCIKRSFLTGCLPGYVYNLSVSSLPGEVPNTVAKQMKADFEI